MDIETAADLTSKSWAKLAKKSRGLTCTLVIEAINSEKTWDEIKDLLRLKLCNANVHTYTLCFMDIQEWEKEPLAAYVHQFKTEAECCNFTNDAATIRIFIKGLWNAQSLAARIYVKDSQTLKDTITEVEKLCNTTTYHDHHSIFNGQHDVRQGRWMFSIPRTRTHCMTDCNKGMGTANIEAA